MGYQQIAPPSSDTTPEAGLEAAKQAAASQAGAISIAVLPFENLSADSEQEFFSAGMTEEITSALAKIPDLRVVGRTSAFQFKGQSRDLRSIGETLNATHLVEGSVRRAGTRLRITAQLVNAESGVSLWTENYDREYADVFAIQEDIATAIAGALRMPLGLAPGQSLVSNRTNDLKVYEDYLRVRAVGALARAVPNARGILEDAVARDPDFAPAWASLAALYVVDSNGTARRMTGSIEEARNAVQSSLDRAEKAARTAVELDARSSGGYGALGGVQARRGKWAEAEELFQRALAIDPDDPEVLVPFGIMLSSVGRLKDALRIHETLLRVEPLIPIYKYNAGVTMRHNGQDARVAPLLEALPAIYTTNYNRNYLLASIYADQGQYAKAADTLLLINNVPFPRQAVEEAARILRTAPEKVHAPDDLPVLQAELSFVYAHVGAAERVFEYPERVVKIGLMAAGFRAVWDPPYAPLRKTERFKTLMRDAGLVDYWRARGWPDLCQPVGTDDFECS
jgi:TolB-like protein/Tfp pilus assembly protein PilF